ncbi:unnamed protein product [Pleuronectes platessa]|uniref:Uncharacterized protein n=1 Tax=Pleuronectes platessa TaxID=8262 RepID=A0A9N7ZBP4_PLEPL|nr:unnamed protein product [Pleuronectes platessa]
MATDIQVPRAHLPAGFPARASEPPRVPQHLAAACRMWQDAGATVAVLSLFSWREKEHGGSVKCCLLLPRTHRLTVFSPSPPPFFPPQTHTGSIGLQFKSSSCCVVSPLLPTLSPFWMKVREDG